MIAIVDDDELVREFDEGAGKVAWLRCAHVSFGRGISLLRFE